MWTATDTQCIVQTPVSSNARDCTVWIIVYIVSYAYGAYETLLVYTVILVEHIELMQGACRFPIIIDYSRIIISVGHFEWDCTTSDHPRPGSIFLKVSRSQALSFSV